MEAKTSTIRGFKTIRTIPKPTLSGLCSQSRQESPGAYRNHLAHNCSQNQAFEGVCFNRLSRLLDRPTPDFLALSSHLEAMTQFIKWCSLSLALHGAEVWLDKRAEFC